MKLSQMIWMFTIVSGIMVLMDSTITLQDVTFSIVVLGGAIWSSVERVSEKIEEGKKNG